MRLLFAFWICLLGFAAPAIADMPARVSIVAFGLWDEQNVFQLEASRGAAILAQDFSAGGRVTVRANTRRRGDATPQALRDALLDTARKMDAERDVLVVLLTSHGSPEGIAVKIGRQVQVISPQRLGAWLAATGIKRKVIIVSSCYSGVFADALADAQTLVITAADSTHPSFGCTSTATWTYFGQAFLGHALHQTHSLAKAFALARAEIGARERAQRFDPSNPQMKGGEAVLPVLP